MNKLLLSDLQPNDKAIICGHDVSSNVYVRLLEMGFSSGTLLQVVKCAPFDGPMEIKIRGRNIVLRKSEAKCIRILQVIQNVIK